MNNEFSFLLDNRITGGYIHMCTVLVSAISPGFIITVLLRFTISRDNNSEDSQFQGLTILKIFNNLN